MANGRVKGSRTAYLCWQAYALLEENRSKEYIVNELELLATKIGKWSNVSAPVRKQKIENLVNYVMSKENKKEPEFGHRFLIGAYIDENGAARITLNHYNCDGDLTDNYIDISLDVAMEKAREHLIECDE